MIEQNDPNKHENEANEPNFNDSDNEYGLPEAEYSPIPQQQPEAPEENVAADPLNQSEVQPQQKSSSLPMWIALIAIVALAGVFVYFFVIDDKGKSEQVTQKPAKPAGTNTYVVEEEEKTPIEEPAEDAWAPAEPEVKEGSVSNINSRTGRYYMIVGSFIDSDLAADYAQKLAKEGYEAKIIEPAGTRKFYRLSVKDAESIADLNAELESMKAKYGENVWIVKY